ncbi:MAG: hypothetical protein WCA17_06525 [Burkholderiales bacterium]
MDLCLNHPDVLESDIPLGAYGRPLSAEECRRLRERGISCDEEYLVVRAAADTPRLGYLYKPTGTAELYARVSALVGKT